MGDTEIEQIQKAMQALEAQRSILGEVVIEAALAPLRQRLAALQSGPVEQRKYVTLLFADISGFTTISENMDAEEVSALMNAVWQRLDQSILSHGGRIDKHMGDGVMAVWSAGTAREDDPERAVRAALDMQKQVAEFRFRLADAGAQGPDRQGAKSPGTGQLLRLGMRAGVHTGPVLLGEVGVAGERTVIGDAVGIAERVQVAAPVGGVAISQDTYLLVRGLFDVSPLGPLQLEGRQEPMVVYQVQRARPRTFRLHTRGVPGAGSMLVGREAEMAALQDCLGTAMRQRCCTMATLVGDVGVGKSRLLHEFRSSVETSGQAVMLFRGRAGPEILNQPYALLRDLFAFQFQIRDGDPVDLVRHKMEMGLGQPLGGPNEQTDLWAHFIGQLVGFDFSESSYLQGILDDARQIHDRALAYLDEYFESLASDNVLVLLLEDIHWADESSLSVIEHLAGLGLPELIVCTARPALNERRPNWCAECERHARLDLGPLSESHSQQLAASLLKKVRDLPANLVRLIVTTAEGNPYFIEELIEVLIEDGVIHRDEPDWRVEMGRLTSVRVPLTLTGVLQARLDSLKPGTRQVLQLASVIGRVFWDEAVQYLQEGGENLQPAPLDEIDSTATFDALDELVRQEMVSRRDLSVFGGVREYVFKNAVLRDVAYESLLRRDRRHYHALAAEWLIQHSAGRAGEYTSLIADHLEQAGLTTQAAAYLRQAGQQAASRFANQEALAYLERALRLTPLTDPMGLFAARLAHEKVLDLLGAREAQQRDLDALLRIAEELNDDDKRVQTLLRRANYALLTSDYPAAIAAAQRAAELGQSIQKAVYEAEAYYILGRAHYRLGDHAAGRRCLETSLDLARRPSDLPGRPAALRVLEANGLRMLGNFAAELGDYSTALPYFEQALHLHRALGDRRGEGSALNNLAILANNMSDFSLACAYHEQVLLIRRETGDRSGEATSYNNLGLAYLSQAEHGKALACLERALDLYRQVGDRDGEDGALLNMGLIFLTLGAYDRAQGYLAQALQLAREIGDIQGESLTQAELGLYFYHVGDQQAAQAHCQEALRLAVEIEDQRGQSYAWTHLGHAAAAQQAWQDAQIAYQRALEIRRAMGLERMAMEPLAGLADVYLRQGKLAEAQACVTEILVYLEIEDAPGNEVSLAGMLDGTLEPFRIYLAVVQALDAAQDVRAGSFLKATYELLQAQAGRIPDADLRRTFLANIACHQTIVKQYQDFERRSK